ncbi:hypothetical protein QE152_g9566 [Popillia japonica]|uniref:Uncharacterized protein n=1 Tax=Popillia japonica TaxID=7064 RepID=A0AAW1LXZ8_POPJA
MFVYLKTNDVDFQAQPRQEAPVVIMNRSKLQKKMTFYFRKVNILNFQTICSLPQKHPKFSNHMQPSTKTIKTC